MIKRVIQVFLLYETKEQNIFKVILKNKTNRLVNSKIKIGLPKILMCGMWALAFGSMPNDASVLKE